MKPTVDLGTYYVRVEFEDGSGYFQEYSTGGRWLPRDHAWRDGCTTLDSFWQQPTWESEDSLAETVLFTYTDGNYSCDCNRALFLARARGADDPDTECGNTIKLRFLDLYGPDGKWRRRLWEMA